MDVFDLDRTLVADYASFARSFTQIRAQDIRDQVDAIYASRRFWPEPLITVNPHFERGASVEALVRNGSLHPDVARVFRVDGQSITLYRHQAQAVAKALAGQSFAVTTGTGSGKSLCFFIPIIDAAIRARASRQKQRTRAIVIYPMNALANSQREELNKFLDQSGLPKNLRPTFARYTGQESQEERERIREAKPDILLTNFMMLELLMTRQSKLDQTVIENAQGLEFIVLDEPHTYRGRQGADVTMLVRRLRDRLCRDRQPLCIGTSATMSSQEDDTERAVAVAKVAFRLFGTDIPPDAVIDETLQRATDPKLKSQSLGAALANVVDNDLSATLTDEALRSHPLAVWIELEIGLQDDQQLRRRPPITLAEAGKRLAAQTERDEERCRAQLQSMLMMMSRPASERGGSGERAFLAFKLHRFFSGAGHVYATLRGRGQRRVTLDGQRFDPQDPDARLYATFFCRNCGQEHHPVVLVEDSGVTRVLPRPIDETPIDDAEAEEQAGYLMPEPQGDVDFAFTGAIDDYPEDWLETGPGGTLRLRSNRRRSALREIMVDSRGAVGTTGVRAWFQPGKFQFCPACKDQPPSHAREINKLASLSAEGRSSATTLLVSSALRWMNGAASSVPADKRKLLGFTDNRQDAALQAGHFNDFLFVSLLRAATLVATRKEGTEGLAEEDFGRRVQQALGFTAASQVHRQEWMLDPEAKGPGLIDAERTLSRVIAHRVWADQRRGWRFKVERAGQGAFDFARGGGRLPATAPLASAARALRAMPEDSPEEIAAKRRRFAAGRADPKSWALQIAADLYTAAFLVPKTGGVPSNHNTVTIPTTAHVWEALAGRSVYGPLVGRAQDLAGAAHAFHWPLEFPDVMAFGGFDVVLGNPPWERTKLQEQEFFASREPEIAEAPNAAARRRLIANLKCAEPGTRERALYDEFETAKRIAEAASVFAREGGRFPLTGRGDINTYALFANTYALFAELFTSLKSPVGRAGIIVPTGLITDHTTRLFFEWLLSHYRLVQSLAFDNQRRVFPGIHPDTPFTLLTMGHLHSSPEFASYFLAPEHFDDYRRRYRLSAEDIARVNPDTKTAPEFRSRADAELNAKIYERSEIIERLSEKRDSSGLRVQRFLDMNRREVLALVATEPNGDRIAVYEGKLFWQFDNRHATYRNRTSAPEAVGSVEKSDPLFYTRARYWIGRQEFLRRLNKAGWRRDWIIGLRDLTNATNERTIIASALPLVGTDYTIRTVLAADYQKVVLFLACANTLVFDFVTRSKLGGTHLAEFVFQQLPLPLSHAYTASDIKFITHHVLELSYTSDSMAPFARDLGYDGPPFAWDEDRRALLRAELDAWYARAYGLTSDELRYILDPADVIGPDYPSETFRVLKKNEIARYGEYRTARLVLAAWDAQEARPAAAQ